MARVLVTGGTGVLGSELVPLLERDGHTVRIMSRSERKQGFDSTIEWAQAKLQTGEGLADAVQDVDVIVHCASNAFKAQDVDIDGTAKLLDHAEKAGVKNFIYISIVGIEKIAFSYYEAKVKTEQVIENANVPYTILRATQFHDLMEKMFLLPVVKFPLIGFLPKDFKFQLIDEREAAVRLAELVNQAPARRVADIGGPHVLTLGEIAKSWLKATGKKRLLIHLPLPGKMASGFRRGLNTCPQERYGKITWEEWLEQKYGNEQADSSKPIKKVTQASTL